MNHTYYGCPHLEDSSVGSDDRRMEFLRLFLASQKDIFRYIAVLVPFLQDAEDILQQTAMALWLKYDAYDPSYPFTPWACRFALLEVKEFLRRNRKWHALLDDDLACQLLARREAMAAEMDRRFVHLAGCLEKLSPQQRSLIEGYYYQRQSVEDLAAAVRRTVDAIYKSLQRIRQTLLECVTTSMRREESRP